MKINKTFVYTELTNLSRRKEYTITKIRHSPLTYNIVANLIIGDIDGWRIECHDSKMPFVTLRSESNEVIRFKPTKIESLPFITLFELKDLQFYKFLNRDE